MSITSQKLAAFFLILTHLVVSIIHSRVHQGAMVALTTFGYVYVIVVITVAPLIAGALLLSRKQKIGALLLALSMLGSFVFGVWFTSSRPETIMSQKYMAVGIQLFFGPRSPSRCSSSSA